MRGKHRNQTHPGDRGHRARHPHLEAERARPADNRVAVERGQGSTELQRGQEVGVGALGHRRAMGRVLVHGEKGSELVFGDQADRVGVHVRLPTKRTRSRPLLRGWVVEMARIAGMPGPTAGSAAPVGRARTLAQVYRHFGEVDAAGTSPLYERVAVALSESDEALRAIEAAPARKRHPAVILAALHDLALAGRAPALAAAYAAADGDAAAGAAIDTLVRMTDSVVAIAVRRPTRTDETGRCAVLYPAIAEAARRVGANAVTADRRGLFGWPQSQCRSRWHHLQQRTIAGRSVISGAAVVFDRGCTGLSRRGRCPRWSPGSALTSIRST